MRIFVIDKKSGDMIEIKKLDVDQLAKVVDSIAELFNNKLQKVKKVKKSETKTKPVKKIKRRSKK